ncbi:DUF1826 domain-containing protein [Paracoccus sp. TK19116]|uniref:DUF1826 domain-containing protein n=1 Tax=Paracoccus albicereus TaxID=2922394 RepID=A0ABT1MN10_9RHOB|nr:DUF1826 domain-containing protein [Paracoccus albicereus]MCQ0969657.1 DUF1826 domain-containing protein [Paracoccus albicereus]
MTALPNLITTTRSDADAHVLQSIGQPGVSLALWQRRLPGRLIKALDALPNERLPRLRQRVRLADVASAVKTACDVAGTGAATADLVADVETLARHAILAFGSPFLEVRLDATEGQPCPKWHIDAVAARLLCTLRGPGTEYGPIGTSGQPRSTHRMERGDVGIFRGALWPGGELGAIVHRSPPAAAGGPRLLVVIDPAHDCVCC